MPRSKTLAEGAMPTRIKIFAWFTAKVRQQYVSYVKDIQGDRGCIDPKKKISFFSANRSLGSCNNGHAEIHMFKMF